MARVKRIRAGKLTDIGDIYRLVAEAWSTAPYGNIPLNEMGARRDIHMHIKSDSHCCFVSVKSEKIVGVVGGQITRMTMADVLSAHNTILYGMYGDKLLEKYTQWAREHNAALIGFDQSHGTRQDLVTKLAGRLGYQVTGKLHMIVDSDKAMT